MDNPLHSVNFTSVPEKSIYPPFHKRILNDLAHIIPLKTIHRISSGFYRFGIWITLMQAVYCNSSVLYIQLSTSVALLDSMLGYGYYINYNITGMDNQMSLPGKQLDLNLSCRETQDGQASTFVYQTFVESTQSILVAQSASFKAE